MEKSEQEELLNELVAVGTIIRENPCGMDAGLLGALREVVHTFIGKHCMEGASRTQVARYLNRDVRTLSRWKEIYDDFPTPSKNGRKDDSYNWFEVVQWKLKHKELFEG